MTRRSKLRLSLLLLVVLGALTATVRCAAAPVRPADGGIQGQPQDAGSQLTSPRAGPPASIDGPYVFLREGQRQQLRLQRGAAGTVEAKRSALTAAEVEVEVDAPGTPRFTVPLREEHPRQATTFPMPSRLLVASDFEGQFEAFTSLMQGNGVLDAQLHWRFGDGHLVLVGDLVDRGPNVLPLLWLVYRMEAEAQAAGGAVHYVLGNHEQMLLTGRTRYVHPKYVGTVELSGQPHLSLWDEHSELGRWLRSKPVLLKVGDHLFTHGGVSPEVLALQPTLDQVDHFAATVLTQDPRTIADSRARAVVWDRLGLLWYRGLAVEMPDSPKAPPAHVQQVLRHFGVRHVVIGHSLVHHVGHDYGGAVLRVDVHHASGTREAVLIEDGEAHRVDASGRRSTLEAAVNAD